MSPLRASSEDPIPSQSRSAKLTPTQRRSRILCALDDGEFRATSIAAWTELSDQQTRADLAWLEKHAFAESDDAGDGRYWNTTAQGREYLDGLSEEDVGW